MIKSISAFDQYVNIWNFLFNNEFKYNKECKSTSEEKEDSTLREYKGQFRQLKDEI